jgi:hypothetical protein
MYAIRQIQQVEDGKVIVYLPADFPSQQVEVIVLPDVTTNGFPASRQNGAGQSNSTDDLLQRILAWDTSHFDGEQMKAYQHLVGIVRSHKPGDPRVFGAFEGLGWIADDFNTMSEEELDLFYADYNPVKTLQ